jgi:AraC-like DNA-binding protein
MIERVDDPHAFDDGTERAEFGRSPRWPGVELYRARLKRHAFGAHVHESYGIGVIEAGAERFDYRGARWHAPAGSVVLMDADTPHTGRADGAEGWRYQMLYVDPAVLRALCGGPSPRFDAPVVHDPAIAGRMSAALRAAWAARDAAAGSAGEPLAADSAVATVLLDAVGASGRAPRHGAAGPGAADPRWRRLADWVDAHVGEPIALAQLAEVAGIGRFHLIRSLRAAFGTTPMAWVQARRLAAARRALARGVAPSQAALACGFADQSHLTRWLARTHGVTPAQYQRQLGSRPVGRSRRSSTDGRRDPLPRHRPAHR